MIQIIRYVRVISAVVFVTAIGGACASAHWSYAGEGGPENWANLDAKNSACGQGQRQSPIDITKPFVNGRADLKLTYAAASGEIVNNGHTIQVNLTGNNTLQSGGKTYRLLQFHFHSPSEEAVAGKRFPLVAHLVHASEAGELAVLAILFETGAANAELAEVFSNLPAAEGTKKALAGPINPKAMLPGSLAHWNFSGSLTTPPCSEGVNWFVLQSPVKISDEQLAGFTAVAGA